MSDNIFIRLRLRPDATAEKIAGMFMATLRNHPGWRHGEILTALLTAIEARASERTWGKMECCCKHNWSGFCAYGTRQNLPVCTFAACPLLEGGEK